MRARIEERRCDRLLREDPEQRRSGGRPEAAAGAGVLAAQLPQLVEDDGPARCPPQDVYLRTAVAVGRDGWAHFDHVGWRTTAGASSSPSATPTARIRSASTQGEPVWQQVPGEYRADLQRLIVVQGDTEPASVEQQRHLGDTAPSLYDLRNLFQVNVEEGRHLWAMVYLLHGYFGRDGREEAEMLLQRNSGDVDSPRILGAFNEETPDWLSFFMFTYFTDRDGKYQLGTLKESAFDPLSRTCEFMLKEEAHHMFVGTTGVDRVVAAHRRADARARHRRRRPARRHPARRDPALPQLPLLGVAGPVRLGEVARTPPTTSPPASRAAGRRSGARTTTCSPRTDAGSRRSGTTRSPRKRSPRWSRSTTTCATSTSPTARPA